MHGGEHFLNDATALVALRTAIAAAGIAGAQEGGVSMAYVAGDFARAAIGGLMVGFFVFVAVAWLRKKVTAPLLDTGISFVVPFGAYITAERFHASGVVAMVLPACCWATRRRSSRPPSRASRSAPTRSSSRTPSSC